MIKDSQFQWRLHSIWRSIGLDATIAGRISVLSAVRNHIIWVRLAISRMPYLVDFVVMN